MYHFIGKCKRCESEEEFDASSPPDEPFFCGNCGGELEEIDEQKASASTFR
jgi:transcription initiation factor IIE alpha subunit